MTMPGDWLKRLDPWLASSAGMMASGLRQLRRAPDEAALVIRPGGMGDLICCCMALESLGMAPHDWHWLIERRSAPWADHLGLSYRCYDRQPWRLAGDFGRYRRVVNTEQRFGLAQAMALALLKPGGELFHFSSNRLAISGTTSVAYDPYLTHEVAAFSRLFAAAVQCEPVPLSPRQRLRASHGEVILGLAGGASPSRTIPAATWLVLAQRYLPAGPVTVLAGPAERALAETLQQTQPERFRSIEIDFGSVCERIATAECLMTMDGGMSHIASYYGIPQLVLFTSGRRDKWAPCSAHSATLQRQDLACQPCTVFGQTPPCPNQFRCHDFSKACLSGHWPWLAQSGMAAQR
ncbi:glycosyltransferase family 9 protein [Chitinimonas sp.]|uniref:glycosyltransferase family 9 protein n=1 Tax=Chitinimonas sp. TaxID=1934313 RepID=UPI0035AF18EC